MRIGLVAALICVPLLAAAQLAESDLIQRGQHIATAADCAACHGKNLSGGDSIGSPMGPIYASNITLTRPPASADGPRRN